MTRNGQHLAELINRKIYPELTTQKNIGHFGVILKLRDAEMSVRFILDKVNTFN